MPKFIVHDDPVGRARSNYIAQADLAPFGLGGPLEPLRLKPLDDGTFSVACIPFQTHGLALGDRVLLSEGGQISEVAEPSRHRVLRMLLVPDAHAERQTYLLGWMARDNGERRHRRRCLARPRRVSDEFGNLGFGAGVPGRCVSLYPRSGTALAWAARTRQVPSA